MPHHLPTQRPLKVSRCIKPMLRETSQEVQRVVTMLCGSNPKQKEAGW